MAVPGEATSEKITWAGKKASELDIPNMMETGANKRWASKPASYSFGKDKQKTVIWYKYTPQLTNSSAKSSSQTSVNTAKVATNVAPPIPKTSSTANPPPNVNNMSRDEAVRAVENYFDN